MQRRKQRVRAGFSIIIIRPPSIFDMANYAYNTHTHGKFMLTKHACTHIFNVLFIFRFQK